MCDPSRAAGPDSPRLRCAAAGSGRGLPSGTLSLAATARRGGAGIDRDSRRFYPVGAGIASMAAAAFPIRDGVMPHDAMLVRHAMQHSRVDDQDGI